MNIVYNGRYSEYLQRQYKELINKLNTVTPETTVKELEEILDKDLVIVVGDNISGVNVVNLTSETIEEWTW